MSSDCLRNGFVPNVLLDGRFETLSPLNHGSFGMVFLARDITTGDHVAIKCVSKTSNVVNAPGSVAPPDHSLELNCHQRLGSHPNLVNMVHAFQDDSHMFLVLEFCPMGDLYEAIRVGRGPLETEHVRSFMLQLVDAVEYMHSKGLYHRDIKPENIMIASDGSLKLGDFGLSTTDGWSNEASVGSDRYMAPEQYDPTDVGYSPAQADIWAIGICLLNALFARNPFVTPSEDDVLFRDFAQDKQSLFDIFPALSQDTFEVLEHSLCMDPARRSLTEMRKALGRVLSFTADDDVFDEFCVEDRDVVPASANRQPLRTPSIQSPQPDGSGAFPWSRQLHLSPHKTSRQLSAHVEEELFPEQPGVPIDAPAYTSIDSLIDSALGESVKSIKLQAPKPRHFFSSSFNNASRNGSTAPQNVGGSLPVTTSKPIRALSYIFGKKDKTISKSWSDLLDEEDEEDDYYMPATAADKNLPFEPASNWSTDSLGIELDSEAQDYDVTPRPHSVKPAMLTETKAVAIPGATPRPRSRTPARHQDLESPIFGGDSSSEDVSSYEERAPAPIYKLPDVYSPPAKRGSVDRWAALGSKRRAFKSQGDLKKAARQSPTPIGHHNRTKSGNSTIPDLPPVRRERKNTGGSWRRVDEANKENNASNKQSTGVFGFGGRMGAAFGFGERDGNVFGFGRKEQHGLQNKFTKEIPKHDMVRIVDWRKGVRHGGDATDNTVEDADSDWVGGYPLHV